MSAKLLLSRLPTGTDNVRRKGLQGHPGHSRGKVSFISPSVSEDTRKRQTKKLCGRGRKTTQDGPGAMLPHRVKCIKNGKP